MNLMNISNNGLTARFFAVVTMVSMVLSAFPVAFFVAEAASTTINGETFTLDIDNPEYSEVVDTTGLGNIKLTFDYDLTLLDANDPGVVITYTAGAVSDTVVVDGSTGDVTVVGDTGSVTLLGLEAAAALNVTISADASGFSGAASDKIELTNITVSGDVVPEGVRNTPDTAYQSSQGNIAYICHANESGYEQNPPNLNSIVDGKGHAAHSKDIIPPFWYQFDDADPVLLFLGKNWDEAGQAIYKEGCVEPTPKVLETVVVTGDTFDLSTNTGWLFNRDASTATPLEFNDDENSIGDGALYVLPITNLEDDNVTPEPKDKFIGEYFTGSLLVADFVSLAYDFQISGNGTAGDANEFYTNLHANFPGNEGNYGDCKFDYVPTTGTPGSFETFSFDASDTPSRVRGTNCPATLAEMPDGSTIFFFAINVGDTLDSDTGLGGYYDKVVVDTKSKETTFDFEPEAEVIPGCTDESAYNYDETATEDDGSCKLPAVSQCIDPTNLLTNGSFEDPEVTNGSKWQKFAAVPGWSVTKVSDAASTTLELMENIFGNSAADGDQYAELDGDHSTRVTQSVAGLQVGATYELSWAFAGRHNAGADHNKLDVLVDGASVATEGQQVDPAGLASYDWTRSSVTFVANAASADIAFADAGPSNSFGTYLDDAQLCLVAEPAPEPEVCSYEGTVVSATQGLTNGDEAVVASRGLTSAVEAGVASYTNFFGKEGNDWQVNPLDFYSLGIGGELVYEFTNKIAVNQAGADIAIWEITGGNPAQQADESVDVYLSEDGVNFELAGSVTGDGTVDIANTSLTYVKFVKLIDTSNGVQGNSGDGYDLDAITIIEGSCDDYVAPVCSVEAVSDTGTVVVENNAYAVATYDQNRSWSASIPGATWVWETFKALNPTQNETKTFKETFTVNGVQNAFLDVAADNSYKIIINGNLFHDENDERNFSLAAQKQFDITGVLINGENTLEIEVKNWAGNANPESNPAGLLYKLVVDAETQCEITTAPVPPATLEITSPATENEVLSGVHTFTADYNDNDDVVDAIRWAIRPGVCETSNVNLAGNVGGLSDASTFIGDAFSADVDMTAWSDGPYCFVVNPDEGDDTDLRETRTFILENNTGPVLPPVTSCSYVSNLAINDTPSQGNVASNLTSFSLNDLVYTTGDEFDLFVSGDTAAVGSFSDEAVMERTADGLRLFFYGTGVNGGPVTEFSGSFVLNGVDLTNAVIAADAEPNETAGLWPDALSINQTTGEVTFTLFTNSGNDSFVITGLTENCLPPVEPQTYRISGVKWDDENGNGLFDESESTLSGWRIDLTQGQTMISTTTDGSGEYYFDVLAGDWTIIEESISGWTQTGQYQNGDPVAFDSDAFGSCMFTIPGEEQEIDFYTCSFGNQEIVELENTDDSPTSRSGSSATRITRVTPPSPLVLGATTDAPQFCPFLVDYMQMGEENDPMEVMKLQLFLNIFKDMFGGTANPVTGTFGATTDANVKVFQEYFRADILDPWYNLGIVPHSRPTGYVYKTTLWKINSIVCPDSAVAPDFVGESLNVNVDIDVAPIAD